MGVSLQGQEHWEEVFAVLEGDVLSLFKDRAAAAQVRRDSSWTSCAPSPEGSLHRYTATCPRSCLNIRVHVVFSFFCRCRL